MGVSTYSFLDVVAAITTDSGGSLTLGAGSGVSKEGISVAQAEDKSSLTVGADGGWMHSLHAGKSGRVTIRLLKTSPLNADLSAYYNATTRSSANFGNDLISVRNPVRGDSFVCRGCGIVKFPDNTNAEDGGMNEWVFNAGAIDPILGDGNPG